MAYEETGEKFTLEFEVRRVRASVTQQEAHVYCNGQFVTNFMDEPKILKQGEKYYGPICGGWASTTPDAQFIHGALFHIHDDIYHISDKVRKLIEVRKEEEAGRANVFTKEGRQ